MEQHSVKITLQKTESEELRIGEQLRVGVICHVVTEIPMLACKEVQDLQMSFCRSEGQPFYILFQVFGVCMLGVCMFGVCIIVVFQGVRQQPQYRLQRKQFFVCNYFRQGLEHRSVDILPKTHPRSKNEKRFFKNMEYGSGG